MKDLNLAHASYIGRISSYRIKAFIVICVYIFLCSYIFSDAADNASFACGVVYGTPTGVTVQYGITPQYSAVLSMGVSSSFDNRLLIQMDMVRRSLDVFPLEDGALPLYYGLGVKIAPAGLSDAGVRIVAGIEYLFSSLPLQLFAQIGPAITVERPHTVHSHAAFGVRVILGGTRHNLD